MKSTNQKKPLREQNVLLNFKQNISLYWERAIHKSVLWGLGKVKTVREIVHQTSTTEWTCQTRALDATASWYCINCSHKSRKKNCFEEMYWYFDNDLCFCKTISFRMDFLHPKIIGKKLFRHLTFTITLFARWLQPITKFNRKKSNYQTVKKSKFPSKQELVLQNRAIVASLEWRVRIN